MSILSRKTKLDEYLAGYMILGRNFLMRRVNLAFRDMMSSQEYNRHKTSYNSAILTFTVA